MDYIIENPDMLEAFKSVAYINVKKLPGLTKSNHYNISIAYNKYKNILLKQIKYYNPDIIIGGSTLHNFFPDLNIKKCELVRFDNFKYAIKNDRIYIDAFHPAQFTTTRDKYCDEIIQIVKIGLSNNQIQ